MNKFLNFLESMKEANPLLVESIQNAYNLIESPQLFDEDLVGDIRQVDEPNLYSENTLTTQFKFITSINIDKDTFNIYLQEHLTDYLVIGVIKSKEYPKYYKGIFSLNLIELNYIDDKIKALGNKTLSVTLVSTHKNYRHLGLATKVYLMLSTLGYVVISDEYQYKGAKALWKKLAYLTGLVNVRIFDNDSEEFLLTNDKNELYDSSNINDSDIWSSDESNINKLLVLSVK